MEDNIIKFRNTFWCQLIDAAMGTLCAVNYAFLYVGLLEMRELLKDFEMWLLFYKQFIDD